MVRNLIILFMVCQLTFAIWPALDILVSSLFFSVAGGFWLRANPNLEFVRQIVIIIFGLGFFGAIVGLGYSLFRRAANSARLQRAYEVVVLAYVLGAGVLVNSILKSYWGRARPADIEVFGGTKNFSPPFEITSQCPTNCSFVSGEGSAVTVFFFGVCLVVWVVSNGNLQAAKWTRGAIALSAIVAIIGLSLRVITGRHFLSDTVFAVLLMALTYVCLLYLPRYRDLVPFFKERG